MLTKAYISAFQFSTGDNICLTKIHNLYHDDFCYQQDKRIDFEVALSLTEVIVL